MRFTASHIDEEWDEAWQLKRNKNFCGRVCRTRQVENVKIVLVRETDKNVVSQ